MTISAAEPDPRARELASDRAAAPVRRLRLAAPVQLELVSVREGPSPEVVWACLPERSREAVLVLLARLIGSGALEQPEIERDGAR
jgi:hypothetical protein